MDWIETVLNQIEALPAWMQFIVILCIMGVLGAPYIIGYLNARGNRRLDERNKELTAAAEAREQEHEQKLQEMRREMANTENMRSLIKLQGQTVHETGEAIRDLRTEIKNNHSAYDNLTKAMTNFGNIQSKSNNDLSNTIIELRDVLSEQKGEFSGLRTDIKTTRDATEATQQTVQDTSKQSQTDMAVMTRAMNDVCESMDKMTRSLDSLKDELVTELKTSREMEADNHAKVFNGLQLLKDLFPLMHAVAEKVHSLEEISKTTPPENDDNGQEAA